MISEKNSIAQKGKIKSQRSKTEVMGSVFQIHKGERQLHLLYLWEESNWLRLSRVPFHTEIGGWTDFVFSRDECEWLLLSLQHQLRRKPLRVRNKIRGRKGQRIVQTKASKR